MLLTHDLPAIRSHVLDVAALKSTTSRIVAGRGGTTRATSGRTRAPRCSRVNWAGPWSCSPAATTATCFGRGAPPERIRAVLGS
ncbi:hypothetical protein ACU686_06175 [Yinghuangia aomiensis]